MKVYRINNIFYSLQGEGANTGRAAVFVRFAGCNLRCPFCDTEFDSYREMTADEILEAVSGFEARFVVLTGGEPTLQVDEGLVDMLHNEGFYVAMESNGTRPAPSNLDWLTVSPKSIGVDASQRRSGAEAKHVVGDASQRHRETVATLGSVDSYDGDCHAWKRDPLPNEIKVVFTEEMANGETAALGRLATLDTNLFLQPCDTGDPSRNAAIVKACVDYIKHHPQWRLSLQTHKLIGID